MYLYLSRGLKAPFLLKLRRKLEFEKKKKKKKRKTVGVTTRWLFLVCGHYLANVLTNQYSMIMLTYIKLHDYFHWLALGLGLSA